MLLSQVGVTELSIEILGIITLITISCYFIIKIIALSKYSLKTRKTKIKDDVYKKRAELVAQITHDLKSPTTAQMNAVHLLLSENFGELTTEQKELLEMSELSCNYMKDLISIIIDTYKSDNGELQISKEEILISELMDTIKTETKLLLSSNNQKLKITNETGLKSFYADKLQIKRVLMNFLTNAILYGEKNSTIEIQILSDDKNLTVNVINNSKYIIEEDLNNIFDKYIAIQASKHNKTSTGLGLYLSKKIIEAHNGKIYAKALQDKKYLFGFSIPIKNKITHIIE